MQIPRWRNLLILNNTLVIPPFSSSSTTIHFALFHSTPTTCDKWTNKWKHVFDVKRGQQPTKDHVRYAIRQKRADAKRALNDLLFRNGSSKFSFQDEDPMCKFDGTSNRETEQNDHSDYSGKKNRPKISTRCAGKAHHKKLKLKRRLRRESFTEDFDNHPETIFQATHGNRWYTWSFNSWQESSSQGSTSGFEWREHSNFSNNRTRKWDSSSESESDDESCAVGSCSDRTILGLPPTGPLKIEDVKNAFRLSALKWHPDKHQGPSQAAAEEKFKLCVNAYKSLCNALSV